MSIVHGDSLSYRGGTLWLVLSSENMFLNNTIIEPHVLVLKVSDTNKLLPRSLILNWKYVYSMLIFLRLKVLEHKEENYPIFYHFSKLTMKINGREGDVILKKKQITLEPALNFMSFK